MKERKEKEEERKWDRICAPDREPKQRRGSCIQGSPLTNREISWNRRGASEAVRGGWNGWSVADRTEWDLHKRCMPQPCMPQPGCVSAVHTGTESWNMGIGEQTQGGDCCWLQGDSLRGREGGNPQPGMLVEETETAIEATCHSWVMHRRWSRHCSLSLLTCWPSAPPGTRKSPHQGWLSCASCQKLGKAPPKAESIPLVAPSFPVHLSLPGTCDPGSRATSMPCLHQGRLNCSRAALGADSCEWPTHRGGDKTTAEPQGQGD